MKVALFSDIHGNTPGMNAVLARIDALGGADVVYAVGDFFGGPGAEDVLDTLVDRKVRMLIGNHDEILLDYDKHEHRIPEKHREPHRIWNDWVRARLSQRHWDLLSSLPVNESVEFSPGKTMLVCHAAPNDPHRNVCSAENDTATLRDAFGGVREEVVAYGHAHANHVIWLDAKLLINVAAVHMFEKTGLSAFTMVEYRDEHWVIKQHMVPFDEAEFDRLCVERNVPNV